MELKEFVEKTLMQIAEGIAAANNSLQSGDTGVAINSAVSHGSNPSVINPLVEFDVALIVTEELSSNKSARGGRKVSTLSVSSGYASHDTEIANSNRNDSSNRVKFQVTMQQPIKIKAIVRGPFSSDDPPFDPDAWTTY